MGPLILFLTTLIWGTAFLAQKLGAETLGPFAMTAVRNVLGGGFLFACILVRHTRPTQTARAVKAGVLCGLPLFLAMVTQQIGVQYTTPGICAFLTTNYVLMVPVAAALIARRLPRPYIWLGVIFSLAGTYFISIDGETLSLGRGEAWTILCAALFSVQMLVVDHYAKDCDLLVMSMTQLLTASFASVPFLFFGTEGARLADFLAALPTRPTLFLPVFYCGVFSSGIAYTLQNFGQARTAPALAAIILSMESVFGALSGYVVLGDTLSPRQFVGCALVLSAAVLTSILSAFRQK